MTDATLQNVDITEELPLIISDNVGVPLSLVTPKYQSGEAFDKALEDSEGRIFISPTGEAGSLGVIGIVQDKFKDRETGEDRLMVRVHSLGRAELKAVKAGDTAAGAVTYAAVEAIAPSTAVDKDLAARAMERLNELLGNQMPPSTLATLQNVAKTAPQHLADRIFATIPTSAEDNQKVALELDPNKRLEAVIGFFAKIEGINAAKKAAQKKMELRQKVYGLEAVRDEIVDDIKKTAKELGEDISDDELDKLERKITAAGMPEGIQADCLKKLERVRGKRQGDQEGEKLRDYLEGMVGLPWSQASQLVTDLKLAKEVLDADHYGLEKVKERIVEQLAVQMQSAQANGTILCLAGPPGVGKTSIGESIARSTGRKFVKVSLGGVRDESDIRGHRTTYVGAKPGRIMEAMTQAGTINPVVQLDEIDKMTSGNSNSGDPTAAMLEVLDPAQNKAFRDHYYDVDYDLSKVMFIATANYLENVPAPLLDRMEVVSIKGYNNEEKLEIAKRYLIPKALKTANISTEQFSIDDKALEALVEGYTIEAGVRSLEKEVKNLVRKTAVQLQMGEKPEPITVANLEKLAGPKKFEPKAIDLEPQVGHVNGLAVMGGMAGAVLPIEATKTFYDGNGTLEATGNLKETIAESVRYANAYVESKADQLGLKPEDLKQNIHLRVGDMGGTPADGPSAGLAIATVITSVRTGIAIRGDVAMTGQIGVLGKSGIIGGVDHKLDGAFKAGIKTAIIPVDNLKDLEDPEFPQKLKDTFIMTDAATADPNAAVPEGKMRVVAVKNIDEVLKFALEKQPVALTLEQVAEAKAGRTQANPATAALADAAKALAEAAQGLTAKEQFARVAPAPANNNGPEPAPAAEQPAAAAPRKRFAKIFGRN